MNEINKQHILRAIVVVALVVIVGAAYYSYFQRSKKIKEEIIFSEPTGSAQIKGRIDRWFVGDGKALAVVEVTKGKLKKFTFNFDGNSQYRRIESNKDSKERILRQGNFAAIHESMYAEFFLREPLDYFKGFNVDTVVYR